MNRIPGLEMEIASARKKADDIFSKYISKSGITLMTREEFDKKSQ